LYKIGTSGDVKIRVANPIFVLFLFIASFYCRSVCAWVVIQIACGIWSSFILYSNAFVMVRRIFFFPIVWICTE